MAYGSVRLKTRLTPYVNRSKSNEDSSLVEPPRQTIQASRASTTEAEATREATITTNDQSIFYSWVAGSLRGVGKGLVESTAPIDVMKKTVNNAIQGSSSNNLALFTPQVLMRMLIPGFFSFETHHVVSHSLFHHVKHQEPPFVSSSPTTTPTTSFLESVLNHQLHFVAGAAGGLAYGLAAGVIEQSFSTKALRSHVLGHGALFGGYDCFSDIFGHLLLDDDHVKNKKNKNGEKEDDTSLLLPQRQRQLQFLAVGLSGGCAGMTQAWVKDVIMELSNQSSLKLSSALQQSFQITIQSPTRLLRAFPPGAAAFSAYEYTRYSFADAK
jgi:hypothetical protein